MTLQVQSDYNLGWWLVPGVLAPAVTLEALLSKNQTRGMRSELGPLSANGE